MNSDFFKHKMIQIYVRTCDHLKRKCQKPNITYFRSTKILSFFPFNIFRNHLSNHKEELWKTEICNWIRYQWDRGLVDTNASHNIPRLSAVTETVHIIIIIIHNSREPTSRLRKNLTILFFSCGPNQKNIKKKCIKYEAKRNISVWLRVYNKYRAAAARWEYA